ILDRQARQRAQNGGSPIKSVLDCSVLSERRTVITQSLPKKHGLRAYALCLVLLY
uniref:Uncharacterized protein n=1 Tax=Aegilops tauschii subsp. strangulata TaxID=200361 RepID=A0A452YZB1_AEGTS